ncbi:unnamed protein product, partial [Mesorhabditis spiculigera]
MGASMVSGVSGGSRDQAPEAMVRGVLKETVRGQPNKFKKLFAQVKGKVGVSEVTEYPKAFKAHVDELDAYKLCVDDLADAIIAAAQQNPYFRNEDDPQMPIMPPTNCDPHELVQESMKNEVAFGEYACREMSVAIFRKLGSIHREYLGRVRKSIHSIRTFINYDYWMDFAKQDLKATDDPAFVQLKSKVADDAIKAFELQLQKTMTALETLPKLKADHVKEVLSLAEVQRRYHEKSSQVIKVYSEKATKKASMEKGGSKDQPEDEKH